MRDRTTRAIMHDRCRLPERCVGRGLCHDFVALVENVHRTVLSINLLLNSTVSNGSWPAAAKPYQGGEERVFAPIAGLIVVENVVYLDAYGRGEATKGSIGSL